MRRWTDWVVGLALIAILVFGGIMIRELNSDAREVSLMGEQAMRGQAISTEEGCIACHTVDGSPGIGPTWLGMFGREETLIDGSTIIVDEEYFWESIRYPAEKQVEGYPNVMVRYYLSDEKVEDLIEFARQLSVEQ